MAEAQGLVIEYPSRIGTGEMIGSLKNFVRALQPDVVQRLGTIYGEARAVSYRNNTNDGEDGPATALTGAFEFVPEEVAGQPDRAVMRSAVCYLPKTVHAMAVRAVLGDQAPLVTDNPKRGKRQDQLGVAVPLMFEISAKARPDTAVGYEFISRELITSNRVDPMAAIRKAYAISIPNRSNELATLPVARQPAAVTDQTKAAEPEKPPVSAKDGGKGGTSKKKRK